MGYRWTSLTNVRQIKPHILNTNTYAVLICSQQQKMEASHRGGPGSNPGMVMWDSVMDKSGAAEGFIRELRFPLPIYIPSASPQSSSLSPEAGTIGQEWPQCQ
jgi:hypothetical protein